jgi:general secretion pathway protein K
MSTNSAWGTQSWLQPAFRRPRGQVKPRSQAGSALLAVLWVSAALAAIAFSLSNTVRGETDHTSNAVDGLRCYYLAQGAVWRTADEMLWSVQMAQNPKIKHGAPFVDYRLPSGLVHVEIIPETAKLNVNSATPDDLYRLGVALGLDPSRARQVALGIVARRTPSQTAVPVNLSAPSSFQAHPASLEEIEELLLVPGITPDIFYGTYTPADPETDGQGPRLIPHPGLVDCLSVFGSQDRFDVNTASPAVLLAIGVSPQVVSSLVERRRTAPFTEQQLGSLLPSLGGNGGRLRVGGNSIVTLRATARLVLADGQLSDLKRTVAAQIKFMPMGFDAPIHVLRWYDTAWSQ